ncbi:MAG: hypothetical protein J0I21_17680 [Alphaproteobacteria bacterium]|nr:hypothetical protein [Alphaproteobacteria bacterium]
MPGGTVRGARATVMGLLLLTMFLLAAPIPFATVSGDCPHRRAAAVGLSVASAWPGTDMPAGDPDCDHGRPCCAGGWCGAHACWISALSADLPGPLRLAAAFLSGFDCLPGGITTRPSAPPPRIAV